MNEYDELRKRLVTVESQLSYVKNLHPEEQKMTELRLALMKKEIKNAMKRIHFNELQLKGGRTK